MLCTCSNSHHFYVSAFGFGFSLPIAVVTLAAYQVQFSFPNPRLIVLPGTGGSCWSEMWSCETLCAWNGLPAPAESRWAGNSWKCPRPGLGQHFRNSKIRGLSLCHFPWSLEPQFSAVGKESFLKKKKKTKLHLFLFFITRWVLWEFLFASSWLYHSELVNSVSVCTVIN